MHLTGNDEICLNFALLLQGDEVLASSPDLPYPPEEALKRLGDLNPDIVRAIKEGKTTSVFQVSSPEGRRTVRLFPLVSGDESPMTLLLAEIPFCSPEETLHLLGMIMDNVNTICVAIDGKGTILHFNRGAERAFKYSRDEVLGKNWFRIFYENPSPDFVKKFTQVSGSDIPDKNLSAVKRKDGTIRYISWNNTLINTPGGQNIIVGIGQDITEEINLRIRIEEEKRVQELLLDMLSHDIGNYIQAARGFLELIEVVGNLDDKTLKYLKRSEKTMGEIMTLVDNVKNLTVLRNREPSLSKQDLREVIERSWEMVLNSLKTEELKGAELEVGFDRGEHTILCDFSILNIFENLFSNAIKHSDKEKVMVKVSAEEGEGDMLRISVEDNGPGIPEDMRERVFSRFDRGVKEGKISGFGLGLSIVKLATERLGGRIWVEEGKELGGARFVLELPLRRGANSS